MDLKELQELLEREKGKIIIVEQGKPVMVVCSYEDFKKREERSSIAPEKPSEEESFAEELTIDDLPL